MDVIFPWLRSHVGDQLISCPHASFEEFVVALEAALPSLPRREARLAQAMLLSLDALPLETGKSLADKVGVPEVTVGRRLRRLGCDGMRELKRLLRQRYSVTGAFPDIRGDLPPALEAVLEAEIAAVTSVFDWARLVDTQPAGLDQSQVGRHPVTGLEQHHVARYHRLGRYRLSPVAATYRCLRLDEVADRGQRPLGASLLDEADQRVHYDHRRDHHRVGAVPDSDRDRRRQQRIDRGRISRNCAKKRCSGPSLCCSGSRFAPCAFSRWPASVSLRPSTSEPSAASASVAETACQARGLSIAAPAGCAR